MNEILTQEQSILSIEDRATEYALSEWGLKEIPIEETVARDRFDNSKDDYLAGANEMLPIIKELGEALITAKLSIPQYEYEGAKHEDETYTKIQTTLDKYQNYL
jgi:hypothetical protein